MMKRIIYLAALILMPLLANAQSIRLLGVYPYGETGQLKAKVDLQGHNISSVKTITYQMSNGASTEIVNQHELLDGQFISADVNTSSGNVNTPSNDMAFQMEVTLDDNTVLRSECINVTNTARFRWLGDYTPTTTATGTTPLAVDGRADDPTQPMLAAYNVQNYYYKGVSGKGGCYVYEFPEDEPIYDMRAMMAVQNGSTANLQMRIIINQKGQMGFTQSNGKAPFSFISTAWPAYYEYPIKKLTLDFRHNVNVVGNYMLGRVYFERNETFLPQTIETSMESGTITYPRTVNLEATATSGGTVYYRLIKGQGLVTLNGSSVEFRDNKTGEVIIEATQYGNSEYDCVVKTLRFEMQTGEQMFPTAHLDATGLSPATDFIYINRSLRRFDVLQAQIYDGINTLRPVGEPIDLLDEFRSRVGSGNDAVVPIYGVEYGYIYRIIYRWQGDEELSYSPYISGTEMFDFMSDLSFTWATGWGTAGLDQSVEKGQLNIAGTGFAKGFGIHANGWVQTGFNLAPYSRMETVVGKQNGKAGKMEITLNVNGANTPLLTTAVFTGSVPFPWYVPITADMQSLKFNIGVGGDGNGSDHGVIGSPRFYYLGKQRQVQTLTWKEDHHVSQPDAFQLTLDEANVGVSTTSGLPIHFRIIRGNEYAEIINGNVLNVTTMPAAGVVEVEAFQPGNRAWRPSESATCRFYLEDAIVVQKNERVELAAGTDIEELVIYADATECGQATVKSGAVSIKRLVLKYTMNPKAWNFISFPTDVNIDKISNLQELGYDYNVKNAGRGTYYIRRYSTRLRTENPGGTSWEPLPTPEMKGLQGYIMCINNGLGMEPREVVFTIDNVKLNPDTKLHLVELNLDFSHLAKDGVGTTHDVYIRPANVKGNTLKVTVDYLPEDESLLPISHKMALKEMRVTYAPDGSGIRLTLPDQSPARVAIYNKSGKRLIKAVNYISPNLISTRDMKRGTYQMAVQYGNATEIRTIEIK